MQASGHPDFLYYEFKFLKRVQKTLTADWATVQGGFDGQAKVIWIEIFRTLELDKKAQADLFLLAHQGIAGRSEANEILWSVRTSYRDLSHHCSSRVGDARQYLDRPGPQHWSWNTSAPWTWSRYDTPRNPTFSPLAVPRAYNLVTGPGGIPLAPPDLWQAASLPAGPPPLRARPKTL